MDLQPTVETTIAAHDYNLRRIISQLNFYANDPRFHQLQLQQLLQQRQQQQQIQHQQQQQLRLMSPQRLGLDLRCVAEIESYPQLTRETSLHALLFRDDIDLKNQKHFKSSGECARPERANMYPVGCSMLMQSTAITVTAKVMRMWRLLIKNKCTCNAMRRDYLDNL